MSEWSMSLKGVDDDYLIGISNKGIVKRAYKDKEEADYEVLSVTEESACVRVGEETVTVQLPLSESRCTCPSRSICRHIILGILALKEHVKSDNDVIADEAPSDAAVIVIEEISVFPLDAVCRIMGNKRLQSAASLLKEGCKPQITYASTITVQLPDGETTVKLLSPLEYSACTCHKKEMCVHKAEAILWCKLEAKQLTAKALEAAAFEEASDYDREEIQEAARQMKAFLEELLDTGLSRSSQDVLSYLERLAIISHNAKLAEFEGYFRALYDTYGRYFKRASSFRVKDLMMQLTRLYRRVELLLMTEDSAELAKYAGEFKSQYRPVGKLSLIGIAMEHFESRTGYAGETVYFLEEHTKQWYTYTAARPVFYDTKGRQGNTQKAQAPWGIPSSLEELPQLRIHVTGARSDERRRLSSSQETKGEVIGDRKKENALREEELAGWYYRDFGKLFEEQAGKQELVFVAPHALGEPKFIQTEQKLYRSLYDENGKEVVIEVSYSKSEAWGIRYIERVTMEKQPCVFGKLYLRDARLRLYPIAVFEKGEIREHGSSI